MSVSAIAPTSPQPARTREPVAVTAGQAKDTTPMTAFAGEGPSFWDLVDVINPLQHIPVVNAIYRGLTGDTIGAAARVAGGTLFGGPIGLALAVGDLVVEDSTGQGVGEHVMVAMGLEAEDKAAVAQAGARPPAYQQYSELDLINGLQRGEDLWAQRFAPADAAVAEAPAAAPQPVAEIEPPQPEAAPQPSVAAEKLTPLPTTSEPADLPVGTLAAFEAAETMARPKPVQVAAATPAAGPVRPGNVQVFSAPEVQPEVPPATFRPLPPRGAESKFMPLPGRGGESKMMPLPSRAAPEGLEQAAAAQAKAAIKPDPAAVQRAMAAQARPANAPTPLVPNAAGQAATVAPGTAAAAIKAQQGSPLQEGWFADNVSQALEKYQRANQLKTDDAGLQ